MVERLFKLHLIRKENKYFETNILARDVRTFK